MNVVKDGGIFLLAGLLLYFDILPLVCRVSLMISLSCFVTFSEQGQPRSHRETQRLHCQESPGTHQVSAHFPQSGEPHLHNRWKFLVSLECYERAFLTFFCIYAYQVWLFLDGFREVSQFSFLASFFLLQAAAVQPEINLLTASVGMEDSCWEQRLRTGMVCVSTGNKPSGKMWSPLLLTLLSSVDP